MKVLALDRDGVVNFDSENYILNQKWRPIPGSLEAIVKAKKFGFTVSSYKQSICPWAKDDRRVFLSQSK